MLDYEKEKEKKAFRAMTWREKYEHIKEYYRMPIILGLVGIFMLGWILNHYIFNPPKKTSLNVTFHSFQVESDLAEDLKYQLNTVFPEFVDSRHEAEVLTLSVGLDLVGGGGYSEQSYAVAMKLLALLETKDMDLIVGNPACMASNGFNAYLMPLNEVFTPEELEKIESLGYVQEDADSCIISFGQGEVGEDGYQYEGEPIPVAVDISGNEQLREIIYGEPVYIGFACTSQRLEEAKEVFWYFLTGER